MNEFGMDKMRFGGFVAEERRRLGVTQKELAQRLFVSDKAVSKWERGLSLPDVSLLIPLAELLGVTVTELLEGRRLESQGEMEVEQVEQLVKRTLSMSEESPARTSRQRRKRAFTWLGCIVLAALELLGFFLLESYPSEAAWILMGLSLLFGCWAWLGAKERLPAYYDENPISFYSDGIFKLSMPGTALNNRNWPWILRSIRVWAAGSLFLVPVLSVAGQRMLSGRWYGMEQYLLLFFYLGGLFLPIYILGRRHGNPPRSPQR